MTLTKRDFIDLKSLSTEEFNELLLRARELKALRQAGQGIEALRGKSVALVFEKSSTRTRVSFEVGLRELGAHGIFLSAAGSQIGRGEPIEDTARVLSGYCHGIVFRTHGHNRIEQMARAARIPVVNALSDESHPCQLLADLQTVLEHFGSTAGLRYAWIGDGNNMAHSWIRAAAHLGFDLVLACPEGYGPDPKILEEAQKELAGRGSIRWVTDPREAAEGADVLSTDVWASMGQEEEAEVRRRAFAGYCLDRELLACANKEAVVLHCLPAHRGEEISAEVLEGPQSLVFQQAENRLHAQKALLELIMQ